MQVVEMDQEGRGLKHHKEQLRQTKVMSQGEHSWENWKNASRSQDWQDFSELEKLEQCIALCICLFCSFFGCLFKTHLFEVQPFHSPGVTGLLRAEMG